MNWKQIAFEQGQKRLPKETLQEFESRVMKTWRIRNRDKTHLWRRDQICGRHES
jgi:hypothetical protein